MAGPLDGLKIIELAGIGPGPYACMLLADLGADVLRVTRGVADIDPTTDSGVLNRSRYSVALNLKSDAGRELVLQLCEKADVLIEGFRPGVTERLGLGPREVLQRNPRLVYGRVTGYGQEGPMSQRAGHDINYISVSGALWPMGRVGERPVPPLNLVGDYGGGSLFLALGVVSAVLSARVSGEGQVVDAAMVDGSASMTAAMHSLLDAGSWLEERGVNLLDTGAHFYEVYETKDQRYMAVGAIEARFYAELLRGLGIEDVSLPAQMDRSHWPMMKQYFADLFADKTREEWTEIFSDVDACVTPVLSPREAVIHPYNAKRNVFISDGGAQPQPAPRFSKTVATIRQLVNEPGSDMNFGLASWGIGEERQKSLRVSGAFV